MRVLVVEDEEDLGAVFRDFLYELGHQPVVVRSAEAALGKLQTERPDAIILDIYLPGMSGLEFLRLRPIRESGLPIVAVSGVATESQARECLRLGALDFVAKPVALEHLGDVLGILEPHALSRRHEAAAHRTERRRALRVGLGLAVRVIEYGGTAWSGSSVDVGVSGMKVRSEAPLAPGTAVKLRFTPPDGGAAIEVVSLALRTDPDGIAFSFVHLAAPEVRRLGALVQRLQSS